MTIDDLSCPADVCVCATDTSAATHRLVFTRAGAVISRTTDGSARDLLVDPTHILLVSAGERYDVRHWSREPHLCTTFGFSTALFAIDGEQARLDAREGELSGIGRYLVGPDLLIRYHRFRRALLEAALSAHRDPAPLAVEEQAVTLLRATLFPSVASTKPRLQQRSEYGDSAATRIGQRHRDLAESAKMILAEAPGAPHRLGDLATALGVSPSQLAHVFRDQVGVPLHQYLLQIRMALALDELTGERKDLSRLAVDLGFATHSHFSSAFRKYFGVSPSRARRVLGAVDRGWRA